jgi:hypothetical protein
MTSYGLKGHMRNMNILRGLSSRFLPCGCLIGVYETYDSQVVSILDAKNPACADSAHADGKTMPIDSMSVVAAASGPRSPIHPSR